MEFKLELLNRNTSSEDLLKDLQNVAKKIHKNSVTIEEYEKHGLYHPSTLQRRFSSRFKALEKAGLELSRSKLNIEENELFQNLEEVWIKLGRQPRYLEMRSPLSKFSASTYANKFGTYQKALENFVNYINSDKEEVNHSEENHAHEIKDTNEDENTINHKSKRIISERLRFKILMRDGFTCRKCGASPLKSQNVELHVDHILPWSKGGETVPENLETKCKSCNLGKGNAFDV